MSVFNMVIFVLLVSVNGQEVLMVNEIGKIVSQNTLDNAQDAVGEAPLNALNKEHPVTILIKSKPVLVRSGRNQLLEDSLTGRVPRDTEAMNFGTADGTLNRSQLLQPSTSTGATEVYGKWKTDSVNKQENPTVNKDDYYKLGE